jgi:membrane associated rhomboid family serine protease
MSNVINSRILLFVALVCTVNAFVFFYIPSSDYTFNLNLALSEPWRFFTFQFVHVDMYHLLENVIGLAFIALVAIELDINFKEFFPVYILSIFIVILPITVAFPLATVAGNSTGIYGLLALCLIKARRLVSSKITLPVILVFMFSTSISNLVQCGSCFLQFFEGEVFHLSGFLAGMLLSFTAKNRPKSILRNINTA